MRPITSFAILCFVLVACRPVNAQATDSSAIKEAALNYVEGYYNADWQRVSKAVSPELAKRIIIKDTLGNFMVRNMGASELIFSTKHNKNSNILNPDKPFQGQVIIYDIQGKIATAKVVTNKFKFIDYVHAGKIDGEWKIINVLWDFTQ
jgi:putative lumazine-binding protein